MRVLLATSGTRGDVQPMLALGVALGKAGHQPLVAAPPNFAAEAEAFGLPFAPVGRDMHEHMHDSSQDLGANPVKMIRHLHQFLTSEMEAQFGGLLRLARQSDLIVASGFMLAASSVAEASHLPFRFVAYTPDLLPSSHHPPMLMPLRRLPGWLNRICWGLFGHLANWLLRSTLNRERDKLGLQPMRQVLAGVFPPAATLIATDPELTPLPPDMERMHRPTGAWTLADDRPLGADLLRFLETAGDPIVYIGFGSMPDPKPEATTQLLREAVAAAGCRAVVGSGWARLGDGEVDGRIAFAGAVPHRALFPRMAAVVHHGGAGTTAAAARAGIPQLLVPHLMDQFGWARRVATLGIGPPAIPRSRLQARPLAEALVRCLRDAPLRARCAALQTKLAARDGTAQAIANLELAFQEAQPGGKTSQS